MNRRAIVVGSGVLLLGAMGGCNALLNFEDEYVVGVPDASTADARPDTGVDAPSARDAGSDATDAFDAIPDVPPPACTTDFDCLGRSCIDGTCGPSAVCAEEEAGTWSDGGSSNRYAPCMTNADCHGYTTCAGATTILGIGFNGACVEVSDCNDAGAGFLPSCCGPGICGTGSVNSSDPAVALDFHPGNYCCQPGEVVTVAEPIIGNVTVTCVQAAGAYLCLRDTDCTGIYSYKVCIPPPALDAGADAADAADATDDAGDAGDAAADGDAGAQRYGTCAQCRDDGNCAPPNPRCVSNNCVPCISDNDCTSPTPRCVSNYCRQCTSDGDCGGSTPYCGPGNACVQCNTSGECPSSTPVCTNNACVGGG